MQTAVEYLQQHFKTLIQEDKKGLYKLLFEQAKEMEKIQIINAFDEGQEYEYQYHINNAPKFYSETYFAETYGSKGSDEITNCDTKISQTEISDEEIWNEAKTWALEELITSVDSFVGGAKWYREQLKSRQCTQ